MHTTTDIEQTIARLTTVFGDGSDATAPSAQQWRRILDHPAASPVTLINFFKFRAQADYAGHPAGGEAPVSGNEAFGRYGAVSMPALARAGGEFLRVASFESAFVGAAEDWDLVVVGTYPDRGSLLALFEDAEYQAAYPHRIAACERQKVLAIAG